MLPYKKSNYPKLLFLRKVKPRGKAPVDRPAEPSLQVFPAQTLDMWVKKPLVDSSPQTSESPPAIPALPDEAPCILE